jgi:pyrroline-5-carboxylate reductase
VAALFNHIGKAVELRDAAEMSAVTPVTALMAPYYQLLDTVTGWMVSKGVRQEASSVFVGSLFHALSVDALKVQGALAAAARMREMR